MNHVQFIVKVQILFSLIFIQFAIYVHKNDNLFANLVRKGRINSLFGSLIVNMAHIDSSFAYFGSSKGSPKYCKRLVNMSAYSLSGNRITRNYSTFTRVQTEICKRTDRNIRPYFGLFFFQVRIFFNGNNRGGVKGQKKVLMFLFFKSC